MEGLKLEQIARAIWEIRYSPNGLFAMLTLYSDEAGGVDHGFIILCGWIASVANWDRFAVDWKIFLAKYFVPYLHMKEYTAFKGPFKKWKGKEGTRKNFLRDAAAIIRDTADYGFCSFVQYGDFEDVNSNYELKETISSPYALCGRTCMALANKWRLKGSSTLDIEYVFEAGENCDEAGLMKAVKVFSPQLPVPIFKHGRDTDAEVGLIQLQAADYLAYEIRKYIRDHPAMNPGRETPRIRKSMLALTGVKLETGFWTDKKLYGMCRAGDVRKRST